MLKEARDTVILPEIRNVIDAIRKLAEEYRDIPLLSRTHGQPASPSTMVKRCERGLPHGAPIQADR